MHRIIYYKIFFSFNENVILEKILSYFLQLLTKTFYSITATLTLDTFGDKMGEHCSLLLTSLHEHQQHHHPRHYERSLLHDPMPPPIMLWDEP